MSDSTAGNWTPSFHDNKFIEYLCRPPAESHRLRAAKAVHLFESLADQVEPAKAESLYIHLVVRRGF